ncbi:DUF1800 domain-containing protein [Yoonia sp. SS1-5]|uniref:DUF1800 domain-containing protein n=1 Tax=Yoonia rhodophyticola TaxID=3137370 RepID=A0AAN0MAW7_9RHOB
MSILHQKILLIGAAFCLMHTPAFAGPEAMTAEEARHLIARTGFGAAPHEIAAMTGKSYRDGIAEIMAGLRSTAHTPMPAWADHWDYPAEQIWTLGQTPAELFYARRWSEMEELSGWWIAEMVATPSPLTERLVLFWTDHFANSFDDHENAQWLVRQNRFLRRNAGGNFADLAHGALNDPAILEYLDNVSNFADAPNENLGREFLELFTLGEGRGYTQDDVRAAALMLTGLTIAEIGAPVAFLDPEVHDDGPKTIFGTQGRFGADDLVRLTLAHPEFGPYIVEKLWRHFISDTPDPAEIARLAELWKAEDLDLAPLLTALFETDAFWDPANRGRLVKSPIELLVGTSRSLGLARPDGREFAWISSELGQALFLPPNVGGWPEGVAWINDATAAGRAAALAYLLSGAEIDAAASMAPMMTSPDTPTDATVGANDLRVGQVFTTYVEERDPGEGFGGLFTLYDVGFDGHTWRSITFWLEYMEDEEFTGLYIFTGDCGSGCLISLPDDPDDPGWVTFEPWADFLAESPALTQADQALLSALGAHLPAIIAATEHQSPFTDDTYADTAAFAPFQEAANIFATQSAAHIGTHDGAFVQALSHPEVLGIPGRAMSINMDEVDDYLEADDARRGVAAIPAVTYATARDWIDALDGAGPESTRAAEALLAVARPAQGQRDALIASDPEALLRRLIMSPAYQLK